MSARTSMKPTQASQRAQVGIGEFLILCYGGASTCRTDGRSRVRHSEAGRPGPRWEGGRARAADARLPGSGVSAAGQVHRAAGRGFGSLPGARSGGGDVQKASGEHGGGELPRRARMKAGVVVFPGSNCDHDAWHVVHRVLGRPAEFLWHKDHDLKGCDLIIIPGGFSYGDYLRCGAIARFSPVMDEVMAFAKRGGKVLGICNGFQVLTEAHLLPGALLRNASRKFVCRFVDLKVESTDSAFTRKLRQGD